MSDRVKTLLALSVLLLVGSGLAAATAGLHGLELAMGLGALAIGVCASAEDWADHSEGDE
jgi:hypothetical protein